MIPRRLLAFLMAICLILPVVLVRAGDAAPVLRALLISVDDFVSQPDTGSSSFNNLVAIRRALLGDARGYVRIKVSVNEALTEKTFQDLVEEAFRGANPGDFGFIYLATHGLLAPDHSDFIGLMSDGTDETTLSGRQIAQALATVPGTKLLVLDACFSGAAINKGMNQALVSSAFAGSNTKVLTSAGGLEPSFLWTDSRGKIRGGSYFTQALVDGISPSGRYQADANRDGIITLSELHQHQLRQYGASTPQVYPQDDIFPVFTYQFGQQNDLQGMVGDAVIENRLMHSDEEALAFSYTLTTPSRIAYQLVYQHQDAWRFTTPQNIPEDGMLAPGRKETLLQMQPGVSAQSGYVLLFILTVYEDWSIPHTCLLLGVQTREQNPALSLEVAESFTPDLGEEAAFILRHQGVILYTAQVLNSKGQAVASLAYRQMSRPLHLQPSGTTLYWNGKTDDGTMAEPGKYRLDVQASVAGQQYFVASQAIELLAKPGAPKP